MKLVNTYTLFFLLSFLATGFGSAKAQTLTLQQCIDSAQTQNKSLQIGRNNMLVGEEKQREAKANLNPKIMANFDYKYFSNLPYQLMPSAVFGGPAGKFKEAQFGVPHNINANLLFSMPLYNPQLYGAIQITEIASEISALQYKKTSEQVFFEISTLYYNAQILQYQQGFIEGNIFNAQKLLENARLLQGQSMAKATDVAKLQLQVSQLLAQKENVAGKREQALNALKFFIGKPLEEIIEIEKEIKVEGNADYPNNASIDMQMAQTQNKILASEANTLRKSQTLPSLSLIGNYGATGYGYGKQPSPFLKFFPMGFAGLQLSYPVFNGGVTKRKINQKNIELQNNALQSAWLGEQNAMLSANAKLQRAAAQKSLETNAEQIKFAQSVYEQTLLQQQQGTASLTDVLLADNALREAQQAKLSATVEYLKADLELKKLTGNFVN